MNDEELYEKSLAKWGIEKRIMQIAEEASELSVACLHYLRNDRDKDITFDNLAEEIADVYFVLDELKYVKPEINDLIKQYRKQKKEALVKVLKGEEKEKEQEVVESLIESLIEINNE